MATAPRPYAALVAIAVLGLACEDEPLPPPEPPAATFDVHEWGFIGAHVDDDTSDRVAWVSGPDRRRPPTGLGTTDLRRGGGGFGTVRTHGSGFAPHGIGKPVLYLHATEDLPAPISVSVRAPGGAILERLPAGTPSDDGVTWNDLRVRAASCRSSRNVTSRTDPTCATRDGYCEALEDPGYDTDDAACLELVDGTQRNHLFYRAESSATALPLNVTIDRETNRVVVRNASDEAISGQLFRVTRTGERVTFVALAPPAPGEEVTIDPLPGPHAATLASPTDRAAPIATTTNADSARAAADTATSDSARAAAHTASDVDTDDATGDSARAVAEAARPAADVGATNTATTDTATTDTATTDTATTNTATTDTATANTATANTATTDAERAATERAFEQLIRERGLTPAEVAVFLRAWGPTLWNAPPRGTPPDNGPPPPSLGEAGDALYYLMPDGALNRALPLHIVPAPRAIRRAFLVRVSLDPRPVLGDRSAIGDLGRGAYSVPSRTAVRIRSLEVSEGLAPEVIRRIVRRHSNALRYCWLRTESTHEVRLRFHIGSDSATERASSASGNHTLDECMQSAVGAMTFPTPTQPMTVDLLIAIERLP